MRFAVLRSFVAPLLGALLPVALAAGQTAPNAATAAITQPMTLTDAQVQGFFDALGELKRLGQVADARIGGDPSRPQAFAQALRVSGDAQAILQKNGFADVTAFQRVGYNVAMAYGVMKQGGKAALEAKMEQSKAQQAQALEKMREHMSPEQAQALAAQMQGAMGMAAAMGDVPEGNIALAEKYADRMRALEAR